MTHKRMGLLFVLLACLMMMLVACGGSAGTPAETDSGADADVVEEADEGETVEEPAETAAEPTEAPAEPTATLRRARNKSPSGPTRRATPTR